MKTQAVQSIEAFATKVLHQELDSLVSMKNRVPHYFGELVYHLAKTQGKVILSGMGKSGFIAQKIAATFNSTGTLAFYMHAADAVHGDLGAVGNEDTLILLSKSGETPEIISWLSFVRQTHNHKIIAIVGNVHSRIAQMADWILDASVDKEVCPLNLAPTTSAVAQLIWGDVLAASLMDYKKITTKDFALSHPGGNLGKRYFLTCRHLAQHNPLTFVHQEANFLELLTAISKGLMGAVVVLDEQKKVLGIITDGDLRRFLSTPNIAIERIRASDIMNTKPVFVKDDTLAEEAFTIFNAKSINQLILVDEHNFYVGMVHIHQMIKEGFSIF